MIITNPKNKKHIEALVQYCKNHGMEEISTLPLWNELVKLIKRIERHEERKQKKPFMGLDETSKR
jgi:hypothetical protein